MFDVKLFPAVGSSRRNRFWVLWMRSTAIGTASPWRLFLPITLRKEEEFAGNALQAAAAGAMADLCIP
ncbi:hypothetical protein B5F25_03870 [Bacteroides sp. An19]|nr:hypothetical protein B5F25_03870 [Bacteroides sp. An19]